MKIFNIIVFVSILDLCANSSFAQIQPWIKLQSPVNVTLRKLSFVDSLTGWATGEAGNIIHTTDGGNSWKIQNSPVQTFITDIFFIDKYLGWAITENDVFPFNSIILRTTNSGNDWSAENFPDSSKYLKTVFFFDSLNGFVGGSDINYTTDGGNSWVTADIDSSIYLGFPVRNFIFLNRQQGYACGGFTDQAGVIWRTTNSGFNWLANGVSVDEVLDIHILDSLNAITLSGDPEGRFPTADLKTTNAGVSWSNDTLSFSCLSFAIDFRTYNEGWSASGYQFLTTTNRGELWIEFATPDSAVIYDLQFTDARNGYAVGQDGVILKFDPTLVGAKDNLIPINDFILYQNYPNPFNPFTKIGFEIADRGFVSLKIYDVLGNEVATLVHEEKLSGKYEVDFNMDQINSFSSGVFFYQLRSEKFTITKKMIYLK